ncbi:hypothetical protein HOF65_07570 [bacterium]|jgi:hypothetical protein|nr:hypothetical protein [bacterium]MBT4632807.1 hypothetical protein [bacterium]MBT5491298.1 hypothetical protein [bacterium]MBT6778211.1 hypothetical protein [bacterium]
MKKLIVLIAMSLFLTSCFDYDLDEEIVVPAITGDETATDVVVDEAFEIVEDFVNEATVLDEALTEEEINATLEEFFNSVED